MRNQINVFVYGTLLFPEITQRLGIVSHDESKQRTVPVRRMPATLRGYQRLTVAARGEANPPAIFKADADATLAGNVLLDITDESLERLDWFEDIAHRLYTREVVNVEVADSRTMEVFTYVCGERIRDLLRGDWDPEAFRTQHLAWYLANVLPEDGLP